MPTKHWRLEECFRSVLQESKEPPPGRRRNPQLRGGRAIPKFKSYGRYWWLFCHHMIILTVREKSPTATYRRNCAIQKTPNELEIISTEVDQNLLIVRNYETEHETQRSCRAIGEGADAVYWHNSWFVDDFLTCVRSLKSWKETEESSDFDEGIQKLKTSTSRIISALAKNL